MQPVVAPIPQPTSIRAERYDRWLSPAMFWLSLWFLVLTAGVLHRFEDDSSASELEFELISWSILIIWPLFIAEGIARVFVCVRPESIPGRLPFFALLVFLPPLRMGCRGYADSTKMWLPAWGWCTADRHLRKQLERFFSVPMLVIAFLVLPVLVLEYYWKDWVLSHFGVKLFLDIASAFIWMGFASEFILMIAVAPKKLRYCMQNWMDVAIVVLPFIHFMPLMRVFRLTRVLELKQVTRLSRLYRMRGLMLKLWRAILLLDVLSRLLGNRKQKRLARLRELLVAKEEEVIDLKKEIADLERDLKAVQPTPCRVEQATAVSGAGETLAPTTLATAAVQEQVGAPANLT